jgi:N utilization substance protein B
MQNNRTRSRKLLFQELYALKFNKLEKKSFYKSFYENKFTFKLDKNYIEEVVDIIKVQEKNFEKIIIKFAPKFKIESMSLIYILPIYIALSEMFFLKEEIPLKVSINEAIDLAKAY